ncbi:MAG TPA: arylsulfatase [Planctomycetaceae bacterium]|nr:arylsulfatase [Planctomycetaceae bacterium]
MNQYHAAWVFVVPALSLALTAAGARAETARSDIVLILADDMGFSDVGCFGGEIRTPHLDRLAASGLRFTQFYNCSRCSPTRAALLTGQYPHKVGLARNGHSLTRNGLTIAEALRAAGYQTAMSGKWHLSETPVLTDPRQHQHWLDHQHDPGRPFAPLETYPVRRGFDRFYGVIWGVVDYFDPFSLVEGVEPVASVPDDYYITDAITQNAVARISEFARSDRPFFLYVAHCAPHWPLHARPEDIARYRDTYADGWHALRKTRYRRQIEMGLFDERDTPLPELTGRGKDWGALTDEERRFQSAKMAVHAAMVDRLDQGVGEIVQALERAGRLENTLIMFLSDNGASPEVPNEPGYDRSSQTRDGRPIRYRGFDAPGPETTYTGIGPRWASAANTPFRYWKMESFEGGSHTPCIVHWPRGLKTADGAVSDELAHVIDVLPTCLESAGAPYPAEHDGQRLTPLDGRSLLPVLQRGKRQGHERLFFEHVGGRAIREGDWKLVARTAASDQWELYNVAKDRTETRDLAAEHAERVTSLRRAWRNWFEDVSRGSEVERQ